MVEYQRQGLSLLHDYNTFLICFAVEITNQILWSYLKKKKKTVFSFFLTEGFIKLKIKLFCPHDSSRLYLF